MTKKYSYEGHMQRLQRLHLEKEERSPQPKSLFEQITEWWETVPCEEKKMSFSMEFFVDRFGSSHQKLGPLLCSMLWQRRRRWEPGKPYSRYWVRIEQ